MPSLLSLPLELREHISSYVLQWEEEVQITPSLREPSYLSFNREIRSEARRAWYLSNTFAITVVNCDANVLTAFTKHLKSLPYGNRIKIHVKVDGQPDFFQLVRWCRGYFDNGIWVLRGSGVDGQLYWLVKRAVKMVDDNKAMGWTACRRAVGDLQIVCFGHEFYEE